MRTEPKQATYNPNAPRIGPGVYCLDDIRQRCWVDDLGGCWVWSGAVSHGGSRPRSSITPRVSLPKGVLMSTAHRTVSVSRVAWLMSGQSLPEGHVVWRTCGNDLCCNPAHLRAGTKAQEGAWMHANGRRRGQPHCMAAALSNCRKQAVPIDVVRDIEASIDAGQLQADISAATGVHVATISKIANGRHIHQRAPVVRGASVFALAGELA